MRVPLADGDHIVVRGLESDADVANGNHWMAGLRTPGLDRVCEAFHHQRCDGRLCAGGASKHCLGPIRAVSAALVTWRTTQVRGPKTQIG